MINIDIKIKGLDELSREFGRDDKRIQRAVQRALKDTAKKVKTQTAKIMAEKYTLPSNRIKSSISIKWPSYTTPAVITFSGKSPGLQHYKVRQTIGQVKLSLSAKRQGGGITATRMKKAVKQQGLTVEVKKGQRRLVKGAWLATYNNAAGVFRRIPGTMSPRYPDKEMIDRLHGPSIMGMFNATGGMEIARRVVFENMDTQFTKEWERELKR